MSRRIGELELWLMARVLISGASGLIGAALVPALEADGHELTRLVRGSAKSRNDLVWEPMREVPPQLVSGCDVVIHLSGESVSGRNRLLQDQHTLEVRRRFLGDVTELYRGYTKKVMLTPEARAEIALDVTLTSRVMGYPTLGVRGEGRNISLSNQHGQPARWRIDRCLR